MILFCMIGQIIPAASQLRFMGIAVDGRGPNNEMRPQLQRKKTKVGLYLPLILQQKASYALYITDKTEHFSFTSRCVVRVAKHLKEDCFIGLW